MRKQLDELARFAAPGLGAAALAGPMLQSISYRAHAERGMIAVAIVASVLGIAVAKASSRVAATAIASAAFMAASYLLTRVSYDAVGSFRMHYSMLSALLIAVALAPLYAAAPSATASGWWLIAVGAAALPGAWWVEQKVVSIYTVVAAAAVIAGIAMVAANLRRRLPLAQLAAFAIGAAIAHFGTVAIFHHSS